MVIFLTTSALVFLALPGQPRFKFEYQKGFPWQHENLVAPFDFAILKSAEEIDAEKNEQSTEIIPYFTFDTTIFADKSRQLRQDLTSADSLSNGQETALKSLLAGLEEVYDRGILLASFDNYPELEGRDLLKKRSGNQVSSIPISRIYSEKSAYNTMNALRKKAVSESPELYDWLNSVALENYISSNLNYDEETTLKEQEDVFSNISTTKGMVQIGERIILQGELVDNDKFRMLESLKASYEKERSTGFNRYMVSAGKGFYILIMLGLIFAFLYIYRKDILENYSKLIFLLLFMTLMIMISNVINSFPNLHIYLVPLAIFPIVVRTFFDSRTAIFMLIITSLLVGFYAPNNYEYVLLQVSAGIVAVFSLNRMHRRSHLILATLWVFLTYILVYAALNLLHEGSIQSFNYETLKWFVFSSLFVFAVYPLVYIFEKLFGFISDVTLIEVSDSNQPLLRKLAEQAPGTFQHSMQIANLAEEVILRIGGNPFLVRAGALYHDIGKIAKPNFFIENQAVGMNPHDQLSYIKSAEVIIDHVENGVKLAQKHNLPAPLIEFIATHHGTTKAKYFFLKHQQENEGKEINEEAFLYPGPLPKSKEAAVVMLVDGIEAAARSLPEKTFFKFRELIHNMINQKIKDGQLDHSDLTFNDINTIKETLLEKLVNIYHVRIEYPKEDM